MFQPHRQVCVCELLIYTEISGVRMMRSEKEEWIYLNNAATSWPKPPEVLEAVQESLHSPFIGGGRSHHPEADDCVQRARVDIADLFCVSDHEQVIFSHNATDALNQIILGFMAAHRRPIHVITSVLEHNSVLRPLYELEQAGSVALTVIPVHHGYLDPDQVADSIGKGTTLAVLNHGSNVIGSVQDLQTIGNILQEEGAFVVADGSQIAGHIPISLDTMPVDAYVFTGHKALFGIAGTGGFVIKNYQEIAPIRVGGTGSNSSSLLHPRDLPERFEAGTHNYPGLSALSAGVRYIRHVGQERIAEKGLRQVREMIDELSVHPAITLQNTHPDLPIISMNINGLDNEDLGIILLRKYHIITRSGLHCAPLIHQAYDNGAGSLRLSLSWFSSDEECTAAVDAIIEVADCCGYGSQS